MSAKPVKPLTKDQAVDLIEYLKTVFNHSDTAQYSELWFKVGMAIHEKAKDDK